MPLKTDDESEELKVTETFEIADCNLPYGHEKPSLTGSTNIFVPLPENIPLSIERMFSGRRPLILQEGEHGAGNQRGKPHQTVWLSHRRQYYQLFG
jgi:hypothetical protein